MTHVLNLLPKSHYLYDLQAKQRAERLSQLRRWLPVLEEIKDRRARDLFEELKGELEQLEDNRIKTRWNSVDRNEASTGQS